MVSRCQDFEKLQGFEISRLQDLNISRFQDFKVETFSRFQDFKVETLTFKIQDFKISRFPLLYKIFKISSLISSFKVEASKFNSIPWGWVGGSCERLGQRCEEFGAVSEWIFSSLVFFGRARVRLRTVWGEFW